MKNALVHGVLLYGFLSLVFMGDVLADSTVDLVAVNRLCLTRRSRTGPLT